MELRQHGNRVVAAFICFCSLICLLSIAVSFSSSSTFISHVEILTGSDAESGSAESLSERVARLGGGRMLLEGGSAADKGQIVIAEGGAQYIYPEMTLRAYEVAMESGADYVTCMLAMTKDGKAVCHPTMDLSRWTNIASFGELASRKSNFSGTLGLHSFEFTLAEIHQLRVSQTKPTNRTTAFDGAFKAATPEEVVGLVNKRNGDPKNKRVGIAFEINENSTVLPAHIDPVKYAIKLLQQEGWTTLDSRAIVISKNESVLELFVRAGVDVQRLLRVPHEGSRAPKKMNLTEKAVMVGTFSASSATGVMLHVDSVLRETKVPFWGKSLPVVEWDWQMAGEAANMAGLPIYVWGFTESTWSATGPHYNTFKFDQLAFYRSLLSQTNQSVAGIVTDWPLTAAKAISCYKIPYKLFGAGNRPVPGRPIVVSSGGSVALIPAHMNISYLQAIEEGADYIDCGLQVSRDKVLFCLESLRLEEYTDVASRSEFNKSRKIARPFRETKDRSAFWSFDFNWTEIQTLRVVPPASDMSAMPTLFHGTHAPISFDKFIDIAQSAKRPVGIVVKIDYPSYLLGKGRGGDTKIDVTIDQIDLMTTTLRERGYLTDDNKYDPAKGMGLIVTSADKCGLKAMHELSQGTMVLVQRVGGVDNCEAINPQNKQNDTSYWLKEEAMKAMSSYVTGVSPTKKSFMNVSTDVAANATAEEKRFFGILDPKGVLEIGQNATKYKLGIYVRAFENDLFLGDSASLFAFNFERDPSIEMEYYYNHVGAISFEAKFVSTAMGFLESSCLPRENFDATVPGFKVDGFAPTALHDEIEKVWNPTNKGKDKKLAIWIIVVIAVAALVLAAIVVALACLALRRKRNKKPPPVRDFQKSIELLVTMGTVKHFTQAELLAATNNFSNENKLGKGGFGAVYKGVGTDGTLMAVKKLHMELNPNDALSENDSVRQLLNEVEIIGTVHNRNVVKLLGICMDKELLLVYDYMPNGSLQDAIFHSSYPIDLGWKHWYNIAVGTAKGLAYLHEDCIQRIIHRDIKPANILLDGQLNPRVADFGLARNVNLAQTHVTTKVMGSLGYVAPEYASTGHLTEKSDTYSFGVLLLTMLTRRRPIGPWEHPDDDPTLLEWVMKMALKGNDELLRVIHPKFKDTYDKEQAIRWLYTALLCTQHDPGLRPAMGDVVLMLSGKRDVPQLTITPAEVILPDYDWRRMSWSRQQEDYSKSSKFTSQASGSQLTNDFDDSRDISQIHQGR